MAEGKKSGLSLFPSFLMRVDMGTPTRGDFLGASIATPLCPDNRIMFGPICRSTSL